MFFINKVHKVQDTNS